MAVPQFVLSWSRSVLALAVLACSLAPVGVVSATPSAGADTDRVTARFVPLSPVRVYDSRFGDGAFVPGERRTVRVVNEARLSEAGTDGGVASVVAVVANVTVVDTIGPGHVTVWPDGSARPETSVVNAAAAGETVATLVTVGVGLDGFASVESRTGGDLVVDLQGVYVLSESARSGRWVAAPSTRLLDTRSGAMPSAGSKLDVVTAGVPADALAVVVNLTAVDARGPGFLTVWPDGRRPTVSNLNPSGRRPTVANQVIVPVKDGSFQVFTSVAAHVVVDLTGWFTGPSAPDSVVGLFRPLGPVRVYDSRLSGRPVPVENLPAVDLTTVVAESVSGFVGTVTMVDAGHGGGFVQVHPDHERSVATSVVNLVDGGQVAANHHQGAVTEPGWFRVKVSAPAHVIIDVSGVFVGSDPDRYETVGQRTWTGPPGHMGEFEFLSGDERGHSRWNPCEPIWFTVEASPFGLDVRFIVDAAVEEARMITGLDLRAHPNPNATVPLRFLFRNASTHEVFGEHSNYAGFAVVSSWTHDGVPFQIAWADVVMHDRYEPSLWLWALVRHELGHGLGLGHVGSPLEIMGPSPADQTSFGPGDLEGLRQLGASRGCVPTSHSHTQAAFNRWASSDPMDGSRHDHHDAHGHHPDRQGGSGWSPNETTESSDQPGPVRGDPGRAGGHPDLVVVVDRHLNAEPSTSVARNAVRAEAVSGRQGEHAHG